MKLLQVIKLGLGLTLALSVIGCSSHRLGTPVDVTKAKGHPEYQKELKEPIYLIATHNDSSNSLSRAKDVEEAAVFTLQYAAELTLERGDSYFAINAPYTISNFDGSTVNNMDDFTKKCIGSGFGGFGSAFDAFGLNAYGCNIGSQSSGIHDGYLEVAFFKEQPDSVLVWNANDVIAWLKKEDEFKEYDPKEIKHVGSVKFWGTARWIKGLRSKKD